MKTKLSNKTKKNNKAKIYYKTKQNNKAKKSNKRNTRNTRSKKNKYFRGGNFETIHDLNEKEVDILRKYTERHDLYSLILRSKPDFKSIYDTMVNQDIYDIEDKIKKLQELIQNINGIDNIFINKAPIVEQDSIVFRGTRNSKDDKPYLGINIAYISTSKTIDALSKNAFRFLEDDCCVYIYTIKKGVPYIDLSKISYFGESHEENQEEILLPRGLKTTLVSISETTMDNSIYKTYNVNIELNNQNRYNINSIQDSQQIKEIFKIFNLVSLFFDIADFMNKLSNNSNITLEQRDEILKILEDFDFFSVNMDTINEILTEKIPLQSTFQDYKKYLKDIIDDFVKMNVITKEEINKLSYWMKQIHDLIFLA